MPSNDLLTRSAAALAVMGPRAVLTSHTAAALHGCRSANTSSVHVLTDDEWLTAPGTWLRVHHVPEVDENDVLELDGLRTLALEAVLPELLCTNDPTATACLDEAVGLLDPEFRDPFQEELTRRLLTRPDIRFHGRAVTTLSTVFARWRRAVA